jgi:hypothetical protein
MNIGGFYLEGWQVIVIMILMLVFLICLLGIILMRR